MPRHPQSPRESRARPHVLIAALGGAASYVVAALLRSEIYRHLSLGDWFSPIDAALIYVIAMQAGVVAMLLSGERILLAGALAGGVGEIAYGALRHYVIVANSGKPIIVSDFISPVLLGALPAALLAAAGAALWFCILHRPFSNLAVQRRRDLASMYCVIVYSLCSFLLGAAGFLGLFADVKVRGVLSARDWIACTAVGFLIASVLWFMPVVRSSVYCPTDGSPSPCSSGGR